MGIRLNRQLLAERLDLTGCGHGHVYPRTDGATAKCGGPGLCAECTADAVRKAWAEAAREQTWARMDRRAS